MTVKIHPRSLLVNIYGAQKAVIAPINRTVAIYNLLQSSINRAVGTLFSLRYYGAYLFIYLTFARGHEKLFQLWSWEVKHLLCFDSCTLLV